jgi:hypothetical protein
VDPGFVGREAFTIFGAIFRVKNAKLRTKFRYESEYLFRAPSRDLRETRVRGPEVGTSLASR